MVAKKDSNSKKNEQQSTFGWWTPFDFFDEVENRSSQLIENQKEWVVGTREQLNQLEENSKKLVSEWKTNTQTFLVENGKQIGVQDYEEWLNKLEDISHKSQQIAFLPSKTSLDLLSKSTEQLEDTYENATEQNRKLREEMTVAFDGVLEQMKQAQKQMAQFNPFYPLASK